ncbi:MAG: hypothetical protein Q8O89_02025 [Nanoarchaeota archaeon]|nr:hypothetical protein [Nanoarchaeota archaeon]
MSKISESIAESEASSVKITKFKPTDSKFAFLCVLIFIVIFIIGVSIQEATAAMESCSTPGVKRCYSGNVESCQYFSGLSRYIWMVWQTCASGCNDATKQCNVGVCTNGQLQSQSCTSNGCSGQQKRTCSGGQWGSWGSCVKNDLCCGVSCGSNGYYCSDSYSEYRAYRCSSGSCSYSSSSSQYCSSGCDSTTGKCKQQTCSAGYKCQNSNYEGYQNSDCSWSNVNYCGAGSCGSWGASYCGGNNVVRARTCTDKGCSYSLNRCTSTTRSEIETLQVCGNKLCSNAQCVNRVPNPPTPTSPLNGQYVSTVNPTFSWQQGIDPDSDAITKNQLVVTRILDNAQVLNKEISASTSYTIQAGVDTTCCSNGQYRWKVRAYDGEKWSDFSSENTFTIQTNKAPNAPTGLRPNYDEIVSSFTPTFTWDQAIDPEGDAITKNTIILRYDDGTQIYTYQMNAGNSYTSQLSLSNGRFYRWQVSAYDGNTWGPSAEGRFKLDLQNQAPNPPIPLRPNTYTVVPTLTPELEWRQAINPENDAITQNKVIVREKVGIKTVVQQEFSARTNFWVPAITLSNNAEYEWCVYAFDGKSWSFRSEWQTFKTQSLNQAPNAPTPIFPKTTDYYVYSSNPTFTWQQASDPENDAIKTNRLYIKEWVPLGSPTAGKDVFNQEISARESFTIPAGYQYCCANKQKYVWQVFAYDGSSYGPGSEPQEFEPYLDFDKAPISPIMISPQDNSIVYSPPNVKWNPAIDPDGDAITDYKITIFRIRDATQVFSQEFSVSTSSTSYQLPDMFSNNTAYEIRMTAKANGKWGVNYIKARFTFIKIDVPVCNNECSPTDRRCSADSNGKPATQMCLKDANNCWKWSFPASCPSNYACNAGNCFPPSCVNDCTTEEEKICSGTTGYKVCAKTSQGCLKWSTVVNCFLDEQCSSTGSCVKTNTGCLYNNPACGSGKKCIMNQCIPTNFECNPGNNRTCSYNLTFGDKYMIAVPGTQTCSAGNTWSSCTPVKQVDTSGHFSSPYYESPTVSCRDFIFDNGNIARCTDRTEVNSDIYPIITMSDSFASGMECPAGETQTCSAGLLLCNGKIKRMCYSDPPSCVDAVYCNDATGRKEEKSPYTEPQEIPVPLFEPMPAPDISQFLMRAGASAGCICSGGIGLDCGLGTPDYYYVACTNGCLAGYSFCKDYPDQNAQPTPVPNPAGNLLIYTATAGAGIAAGDALFTWLVTNGYLVYKGGKFVLCGVTIFGTPFLPFVDEAIACGWAVSPYYQTTENATYILPMSINVGNVTQNMTLIFTIKNGNLSNEFTIAPQNSANNITCYTNRESNMSICKIGNYTFETKSFNNMQSSFNLLWNEQTNESYYSMCDRSNATGETSCILTNDVIKSKVELNWEKSEYSSVQKVPNQKLQAIVKSYTDQIINKTIKEFGNSTQKPTVKIKLSGMKSDSKSTSYFQGSILDTIYIVPTENYNYILKENTDLNSDADKELKVILAHEIGHLSGTQNEGVADWFAESIAWNKTIEAPSHKKFREYVASNKLLINNLPTCEESSFDPISSNANGTYYCVLKNTQGQQDQNQVYEELVMIDRGATADFLEWTNKVSPQLTQNKTSLYKITSGIANESKYSWYVTKWKRIYDDSKAGDINFDDATDVMDLSKLGKNFNTRKGDEKYDLFNDINNDGSIDVFDLSMMGKSFGR